MLELRNVTRTFKTDDFVQNAVDDVSIKFKPGQLTAILGESGSGKSTLLNVISGLDKPTSGNIIIDGVDTKKFSKTEWATYRNHYVGFIFQEYNLIKNFKAVENVEMPLLLQGVSAKEARQRALEKLELVGLSEHANKLPIQLSGGQCQRVAIARALVTDPKIILADEPTGALDYELGLKTINFIKKVCSDKIILLVTHDTEISERFADRIIEMKDGKIISDTAEVVEEESEVDSFNLKKPKMSLKMAFKLAKRNVSSRVLRTIFTAATVSIGLICIFLLVFLMNGMSNTVDDLLGEILPKNVYIVTGQTNGKLITQDDIDSMRSIENVDEIVPVYQQYISASYGEYENSYVETTTLPNNAYNFTYESKVYGRYPEKDGETLISVSILKILRGKNNLTKPEDIEYEFQYIEGESITLIEDAFADEIKYDFKVVGVVEDSAMEKIYLREADIEKFVDSEPTSVNMYLKDNSDSKSEEVEAKLEELGYSSVNYYKLLSNSVNELFDRALGIMIFAAIGSLVVAGILIALIIYTSVVERIKEIGILNAIGAKGFNIASIFVIESGFIGVIASFVGFGIAFLISKLLNAIFGGILEGVVSLLGLTLDVKLFQVDVLWVILVFVLCTAYTILIGILPAIKAARTNAVNALRKE